jgi:flagellar protein FliO/FliZ
LTFSLYLGGEKLKPLLCYHSKFRVLFIGISLILLVMGPVAPGAQEQGEGPDGPVVAADAAVTGAATGGGVAPEGGATGGGLDERTIRLGEESSGVPVAAPAPVSGFAVLRAVLLLILAAAAIYGLVYAVKKLSRPRDMRNPHLRVLATTRLGPNRFVHVVALGTRGWLVGSGEGGISHIADIQEQEALDALFLEESRRAALGPSGQDFRSLLRRLGIGGGQDADRGGPVPGPDSPPAGSPDRENGEIEALAENIRRRRDRLRGL